jgi:hypothetical protein
MPAPTPSLKSVEVLAKVNAILAGDVSHFIPEDDATIQRLLRDAARSISANPAYAYAALAGVYQLTGNAEKARYNADNALKLASSEYRLIGHKSSILINLGFCSEALEVYQRGSNPEFGQMTWMWPQGYACGAFNSMVKHLRRARAMQIDLHGLDTETAEKAAAVLEKTGISESQIATALDIIGTVLREHKLFYLGPIPKVTVFDEPGHEPFIHMAYSVGVASSSAHELYQEFVDRASTPLQHFRIACPCQFALTSLNMPVKPRDLLESARQVREHQLTEAGHRTAISRAYYAGYHAARQFHDSLPTPGSVKEAKGVHEQLATQLVNPTVPTTHPSHIASKRIGYMLRDASRVRITSDYRLTDTLVDKDADDVLQKSDSILTLCKC